MLSVLALLVVGVGGLSLDAAARGLMDAGLALGTVELLHPWWLLVVLLWPALVALAMPSPLNSHW